MNSLCAYSTADEIYVPAAAATLLSVRNQNPDIPLFIIGTKYSQKSKDFLAKYKIEPIEIDLSGLFYKAWGKYPAECYYLFAGPELFKERGFSHSLYIDGDIYCNQNPAVDLKKIKTIAGVTNGQISAILRKDFETIQRQWPGKDQKQERVQTGVLYFNNAAVSKFKFLDKISQLFDQAIKLNIPRKGDDSLFALFQYIYPELNYLHLSRNYNFIEREKAGPSNWQSKNSQLTDEAIFYHFTDKSPKPWLKDQKYPNYASKYFAEKWVDFVNNALDPNEVKKYFPEIAKSRRLFKWF